MACFSYKFRDKPCISFRVVKGRPSEHKVVMP
jgi:hypothetical protein